jgi:hypothetical protein
MSRVPFLFAGAIPLLLVASAAGGEPDKPDKPAKSDKSAKPAAKAPAPQPPAVGYGQNYLHPRGTPYDFRPYAYYGASGAYYPGRPYFDYDPSEWANWNDAVAAYAGYPGYYGPTFYPGYGPLPSPPKPIMYPLTRAPWYPKYPMWYKLTDW